MFTGMAPVGSLTAAVDIDCHPSAQAEHAWLREFNAGAPGAHGVGLPLDKEHVIHRVP